MKYILFFILTLTTINFGQELNCKITVNMEKIQTANKDLLTNFQKTIEDYMNKTRFTNERWEGGKIECSFNILFQSANDNMYTAQVVVSSQRPIYKSLKNSLMLNVNDGSWTFLFEKNQQLQSNQSVYDPVTSFLDYYAYVIIGLDADSYDKLGGSPFFSKALDLVNLGATSGTYSAGWQNSSAVYSRRGLVEDLMNEKFRAFREAIFDYHYNGIDIFQFKKDIALQNIVKLVNTLDAMRTKVDLRSVFFRVFFDAKNGEIAEYLKALPNRDIFKTLKKIDPSHTSKYDEAMNSF